MSKSGTNQPARTWQIEFDEFDGTWTLNNYVNDKVADEFQVISIETIKVKNKYNEKVERYRLWYRFLGR